MTYATIQNLLKEVNDNIGFELYAVRFSGKGRTIVLYEYNKLIARGRTAVENEVIELYNSFGGGKF